MDRDLVIQLANSTRDLSLLRLLAKPLNPVNKATKNRIWKRFIADSARPIAEIAHSLYQLRNFADNSALRSLADRATKQDPSAVKELRYLGIKLKQDLVAPCSPEPTEQPEVIRGIPMLDL